jgi:hypothetical protein
MTRPHLYLWSCLGLMDTEHALRWATLAAVSRELDVSRSSRVPGSSSGWRGGQVPRATESEAEELTRLHRDVAVLEPEREFRGARRLCR